MVQHADALYEIERLSERFELQDVALRVFDVRDAQLSRLSLRVGEARGAQVDRQNPGRREPLRRLNRLLPGTATGYQHVDVVALAHKASFDTELFRHEGLEPNAAIDRGRPDPSWIRTLLVLARYLSRDLIVDGCQPFQREAIVALLKRFLYLL